MIDILLSTDKKYIMPTGVTMKSISMNNKEVTFHILIDDGVTEKQKQQLTAIIQGHKMQNICFYKLDSKSFKNFPSLGKIKSYITIATYYRLFITEVLPQSIKQILYLDGDVINVKPLDDLWNIDISKYALGAVTDMAESKHDFVRLGYDSSKGYFNAGVLLINLDYWRRNNLKQKFMDLILFHPEKIVLHDQDVLNICLYDMKKCLPMKYNVQNGFLWEQKYNQFGDKYTDYEDDLKNAVTDPVIIHFTDNKKPWHVEDCNPLSYEWFKYFKQTEWKYIPLGHCNKSKVRYIVAKVLRKLKLIPNAITDEYKYKEFFN